MTEDNALEHVSTGDLIAELRRRARTIFVAMRPLGDMRDFTAIISMGVDGSRVVTADDRDRCLGLAFQAMQHSIPKEIED